jgi:hypothetical protein
VKKSFPEYDRPLPRHFNRVLVNLTAAANQEFETPFNFSARDLQLVHPGYLDLCGPDSRDEAAKIISESIREAIEKFDNEADAIDYIFESIDTYDCVRACGGTDTTVQDEIVSIVERWYEAVRSILGLAGGATR